MTLDIEDPEENPEAPRPAPELADIQALIASLPDRDTRTPEELLGYDEFGLPALPGA